MRILRRFTTALAMAALLASTIGVVPAIAVTGQHGISTNKGCDSPVAPLSALSVSPAAARACLIRAPTAPAISRSSCLASNLICLQGNYADVIRNEAHSPTMSTAYMTTSNQANTLLAGGRCDLVLYSPRAKP